MKNLFTEVNSRNRIIEYLNDKPLSDAVLTYVPKNTSYEGMTISDIAQSRKLSLGETLVELLDECDMQIGYLGAPPHNVQVWNQLSQDALKLLSRPDYMIGSDAIPLGSMPHPRAYGTFPRFLGRFRRRFGGVKLETLIQRVTQNPAVRFGLKGAMLGITICEDLWEDSGPGKILCGQGNVDLLLNISSSPFHKGKGKTREKMIQQRARSYRSYIAYVNLVGGQDELVFDGQSLVVAPCLLYTSPSPRDATLSRMPSSA